MSSQVPQVQEGYAVKSIRLLDVGYVAIIYLVFGLLLAKVMDYFYGEFKYRDERAKSTGRVAAETAGMMWLNGVVIYFVKHIASLIPFPFNGVYGYDHTQLQEVANTTLFVYAFLYFQRHFTTKARGLYNRISQPPARPVLTRKQLAVIHAQIRQQLREQNIRDRRTMKAIYDAAMSQALARAVEQARQAEDSKSRTQNQLEQERVMRMRQELQAQIDQQRLREQLASNRQN